MYSKNKKMEYSARQVRNDIVLKLNTMSFKQETISQIVNLSQQMVSTILGKSSKNLPVTSKHVGAKRRLDADSLTKLPIFLEKGAEFYGFEGAYWTHARVGHVIKEAFKVSYEDKQVGRILKLINWTWQKPQKKDAQQDLQKVEKWKTEELPALKKKR
jgi:transposase